MSKSRLSHDLFGVGVNGRTISYNTELPPQHASGNVFKRFFIVSFILESSIKCSASSKFGNRLEFVFGVGLGSIPDIFYIKNYKNCNNIIQFLLILLILLKSNYILYVTHNHEN
jgi:hypothetical protein